MSRQIDRLIDSYKPFNNEKSDLISYALFHPTAVEPHHIDKILDSHPHLSNGLMDSITRYVPEGRDPSDYLPTISAVTPTHIGRILKDPDVSKHYKLKLLTHPKLLPSHLDHVLNSPEFGEGEKMLALAHPTAVRPRHIDDILDNPNKYVSRLSNTTALSHPTAVRPRHIDKMLKNPDKYTNYELNAALSHPTAVTPEHKQTISQNPNLRLFDTTGDTMDVRG